MAIDQSSASPAASARKLSPKEITNTVRPANFNPDEYPVTEAEQITVPEPRLLPIPGLAKFELSNSPQEALPTWDEIIESTLDPESINAETISPQKLPTRLPAATAARPTSEELISPAEMPVPPATEDPNLELVAPPEPELNLRYEVLIRAARNAVALENRTLAIERFQQLLDEFPETNDARAELSGLLVAERRFSEALSHLETLVARSPDRLDWQLAYAELLIQLERLSDAEAILQQIVSRDRASAKVLILLARVLAWQGKTSDANRLYEQNLGIFTSAPTVPSTKNPAAELWPNGGPSPYPASPTAMRGPTPDFPGETEAVVSPLQLGQLLLELGRPQDAMAHLRTARQTLPLDPHAIIALVHANAQLGNDSAVYQSLNELSQLPDLPFELVAGLGDRLYRDGAYRAALIAFQQALATIEVVAGPAGEPSPDSVSAHVDILAKIARVHTRLYEFPAAAAALDDLREVVEDRRVRVALAEFHLAIGEYASAHAVYQSLLLADSNDVDALRGLGSLYHALTDFEQATVYYRRALAVDANNARARNQLADSLVELRRVDEAIATLASSPSADKSDITYAADLPWPINQAPAIADILLRGERTDAAESVCLTALPQVSSPGAKAALMTTLGLAQLELGRFNEAKDTLQRTRRLPRGDAAKLRYGLYRCHRELSQLGEAEAALQDELASFGSNNRDRLTIADLALEDCDCNLARRVLQHAATFDPENVLLQLRLGEAQSQCQRQGCMGPYQTTSLDACSDRASFVRALELSPTNTRAKLGLARSLTRTNNFAEADQQYLELIKSLPTHELARRERARLVHGWLGVDRGNLAYLQDERANEPTRYLPNRTTDPVQLSVLQDQFQHSGQAVAAIQAERSGKYWKDWRPSKALCQYETLIGLEPRNQEGLFDIAQIYATQDQTRKSIAAYNRLLSVAPCHAEAITARARMQLETGPQLRSSFDFEHRTGREGLTDITLLRLETLAVKPYGDVDEYFAIGYAHRFLRPHRGDDADGNTAIFSLFTKPLERINVYATLELENYDSGFSTRPTFDTGVRWRTPNDGTVGLSGFLENVVENGESIRQDTYRGGFELSAVKWLSWRWQVDGLYRYAAYSDRNSMHEMAVRSDYLLRPGRHQWHAKADVNLVSYDEQTRRFNAGSGVADDQLFGAVHPYFSPSGFVFATGGLEHRTWLNDQNFRGANEHWVSAYAGARIDSDNVGYGLMRLRWHRDAANWLSFQLDHSAIYSAVYQNVGLAGFVTLRMP